MEPVEQTGNGYHYNQAVGEVQSNQLHSVEASIVEDYQQSPQVSRIENSLFNESITSTLLASSVQYHSNATSHSHALVRSRIDHPTLVPGTQ